MPYKKRVNKPTDKRFPQALEALAAILEDCAIEAPLDVQRIALASRGAMLSKDPRASINKRLIGLRTAHPEIFNNTLDWLWEDQTKSLFTEYGSHWALSILEQAFISIDEGETPHVALGMAKGGNPDSWNITVTEDAAIYAHDLRLNQGYSIDNAKMVAANVFGTDKANINKAKLPEGISASDIATQSMLIKGKHKL